MNIPKTCPNVPSDILSPKNTWADKDAYDKAAKDLALRFQKNFEKYDKMPEEIRTAGPRA